MAEAHVIRLKTAGRNAGQPVGLTDLALDAATHLKMALVHCKAQGLTVASFSFGNGASPAVVVVWEPKLDEWVALGHAFDDGPCGLPNGTQHTMAHYWDGPVLVYWKKYEVAAESKGVAGFVASLEKSGQHLADLVPTVMATEGGAV